MKCQNFVKDYCENNMLHIDALLTGCVHTLPVGTYLTMINECSTISFFNTLCIMEKIYVKGGDKINKMIEIARKAKMPVV